MTVTRRGNGETPGGYERRKSEVRRTDRRWLVTIVFIVIVASFGGFRLTAQQNSLEKAQRRIVTAEREAIRNCQLLNDAHRKFDALLDFSVQNTLRSQQLSEAEKQKRIKQFADFHLPILHCPVI